MPRFAIIIINCGRTLSSALASASARLLARLIGRRPPPGPRVASRSRPKVFSVRDADDRADHQTHHFVEKSVAVEVDRASSPPYGARGPSGSSAWSTPRLAAIGGEAGEIMRAHKERGALSRTRRRPAGGDMPRAVELQRARAPASWRSGSDKLFPRAEKRA